MQSNMWSKFLILILLIASCTIIETTVESTKKISNAVIDETVELSKTIISIPVDATKTIVDKIDEELNEADTIPAPQEKTIIQQTTVEEDKSIYASLYGLAAALFIAILLLFIFMAVGIKSKPRSTRTNNNRYQT